MDKKEVGAYPLSGGEGKNEKILFSIPCRSGVASEHNPQYNNYNIAASTQKLVSMGNTYNWHGIDKTNVTIFDRDNTKIETNMEQANQTP